MVEDLFRLVITYAVANEIRFPTPSLGVTPPDTELMERWLASGSLRLEEPRRALGLFGPGVMVGSLLGVSARIVGTAEELLEATARARGEAL